MLRTTTIRWLLSYGVSVVGALAGISTVSADCSDPSPMDTALRPPKRFKVVVQTAFAKPGQEISIPITFQPEAGWDVDTGTPVFLKLFPPADVTARKLLLDEHDATLSKRDGRFEINVIGSTPGKKIIPTGLTFTLCNATACEPQRTKVCIEMEVK
jgi:hypothetical protein